MKATPEITNNLSFTRPSIETSRWPLVTDLAALSFPFSTSHSVCNVSWLRKPFPFINLQQPKKKEWNQEEKRGGEEEKKKDKARDAVQFGRWSAWIIRESITWPRGAPPPLDNPGQRGVWMKTTTMYDAMTFMIPDVFFSFFYILILFVLFPLVFISLFWVFSFLAFYPVSLCTILLWPTMRIETSLDSESTHAPKSCLAHRPRRAGQRSNDAYCLSTNWNSISGRQVTRWPPRHRAHNTTPPRRH